MSVHEIATGPGPDLAPRPCRRCGFRVAVPLAYPVVRVCRKTGRMRASTEVRVEFCAPCASAVASCEDLDGGAD